MTLQTGCSSLLAPLDCALVVGLTYLLSSILGLLLKQLCSRRLLMLVCNCSAGNLQSLNFEFQSSPN